MTKKKKCYFEISASFYLLSWSFPKICLSVCQKLRIFACERKNQRWKDMELMLIRKSGSESPLTQKNGSENRPLTHVYESKITHTEPAGNKSRKKILEYEKLRAQQLRENGELNEGKHIRP